MDPTRFAPLSSSAVSPHPSAQILSPTASKSTCSVNVNSLVASQPTATTLSAQRSTASTTSCGGIGKPFRTVAADVVDARSVSATRNSDSNGGSTAPPLTMPSRELTRQQQPGQERATQLQQKSPPLVKEQTRQSTTPQQRSTNNATMAVPEAASASVNTSIKQSHSQTQSQLQQQQSNLRQHVDQATTVGDATTTQRQRKIPNMKVRPKRSGRVAIQFGQMHQFGDGSESDPVVIEHNEIQKNNCEKKDTPRTADVKSTISTGTVNNSTSNIDVIDETKTSEISDNSKNSLSGSSKTTERIIGFCPPKSIQNIQKTFIGSFGTSNKNHSNNNNNNININNLDANKSGETVIRAQKISELKLDLSPRLIRTNLDRQQMSTSSKKQTTQLKKPEIVRQTVGDPPMIPSPGKAPIPGSAAAAVVQVTAASQVKETTAVTSAPLTTSTASTLMASANKLPNNGRTPAVTSTQVKTTSVKAQNGAQMPQSTSSDESMSKTGPNDVMTGQNATQIHTTIKNTTQDLSNSSLQTAEPKQLQATNNDLDKSSNLVEKLKETSAQANPKPSDGNKRSVGQSVLTSNFNWDIYLGLKPNTVVAPDDAFMQAKEQLPNDFVLEMRLEARDPRNDSSWCLARVVGILGPRLKLRLEGVDASNDFWELVDSANIRSVGTGKGQDPLLPPIGYIHNLSNYSKYVEKQLAKSLIAPPQLFISQPKKPERNIFKVGMKLEAVDRKHPHMICPATVDLVHGDELKIAFDGWRGSFDYSCKYYSRDIFPVKWCEKNNFPISAPQGWEDLLAVTNEPAKGGRASTSSSSTIKSAIGSSMPTSQIKARKHTPRGQPRTTASTLPETTKSSWHAHSPSPNTSNSSHSRGRGRPASTKKASDGDSRKLMEKESFKAGKEPSRNSTPDDDVEEVEDNEPLPHGVNKFQCRRTMSFDEWQREKNSNKFPDLDSTMDNEDVPVSSPQKESPTPTMPPIVVSKDKTPNSTSTVDKQDTPNTSTALPDREEDGHISKKAKLKLERGHLEISLRSFSQWSVTDVLEFIKFDDTLAKYAKVFENHEIDGKAFLLLTTDVMIKHMGLKIGPVLKINDMIEKVKRGHKL